MLSTRSVTRERRAPPPASPMGQEAFKGFRTTTAILIPESITSIGKQGLRRLHQRGHRGQMLVPRGACLAHLLLCRLPGQGVPPRRVCGARDRISSCPPEKEGDGCGPRCRSRGWRSRGASPTSMTAPPRRARAAAARRPLPLINLVKIKVRWRAQRQCIGFETPVLLEDLGSCNYTICSAFFSFVGFNMFTCLNYILGNSFKSP